MLAIKLCVELWIVQYMHLERHTAVLSCSFKAILVNTVCEVSRKTIWLRYNCSYHARALWLHFKQSKLQDFRAQIITNGHGTCMFEELHYALNK